MQKKNMEIKNKLARDGNVKIKTSWSNLTTLQPVLQEMMNEAAGTKPGDPDATEISEEQFMKILVKQIEKPL